MNFQVGRRSLILILVVLICSCFTEVFVFLQFHGWTTSISQSLQHIAYDSPSLSSSLCHPRNTTDNNSVPPPPFSPYHTLPLITGSMAGLDGNRNTNISINGSNNDSTDISSSSSSLVVFVLTRNDSFGRRQVIRETWANNRANVYFVVGTFCTVPPEFRDVDEGDNALCRVKPARLGNDYAIKTVQYIEKVVRPSEYELHQEQAKYGDILVMDAVETYRNLPKKVKTAYTFVDRYLSPNVGWILKVDDDMFVRVQKLERYLWLHEKKKKLDPTQPTVLGAISNRHQPHQSGKWKEVVQFPRTAMYPSFPLGSAGHLVSRPVAEYVSKYRDALFEYQGEDVSLGIWLAAGRNPDVPDHPGGGGPVGPEVRFETSSVMRSGGNCKDGSIYVLGHDFDEANLRKCQDFWDKRDSTKKN